MSRNKNILAVGATPSFGTHNMGFRHLSSMDVGRIQPIVLQECVPNDVVNLNMAECVATSAPNVAPLQGKYKMNCAAFYVPNRVVWQGFNDYISGLSNQAIPSFDLADIAQIPQGLTGVEKTDYYAYFGAMGLPTQNEFVFRHDANGSAGQTGQKTSSLCASLLPFRAINRIWWDWYRDPNVIPDSNFSTYVKDGNTSEALSFYSKPHYATWEHTFISNTLRLPNADGRTLPPSCNTSNVAQAEGVGVLLSSTSSVSNSYVQPLQQQSPYASTTTLVTSTDDRLKVPMTASNQAYSQSNASIPSLRYANALQGWLEKCNVLGGKLIDRLRGMFGSSVSPITIQMSEYLGRSTFALTCECEASNASTSMDGTSPNYNAFGSEDPAVATMKGQLTGKSAMTKNGLGNIHYKVNEHGYFIVLAWIMPDVMVYDGLAPHWLRGVDGLAPSRFDFLTPELVGTGFDPLYSYEVYLPKHDLNSATGGIGAYDPFNALGYRGKYENYKYNKDIVSGCFADLRTRGSMRSWWLGRDLLRENGLTDATGAPVSGKTSGDYTGNITHDTLSQLTPARRQPYDDPFTFSSSEFDHWVTQWNIDLQMTRPIGALTAPKIELSAPSAQIAGGSHL